MTNDPRPYAAQYSNIEAAVKRAEETEETEDYYEGAAFDAPFPPQHMLSSASHKVGIPQPEETEETIDQCDDDDDDEWVDECDACTSTDVSYPYTTMGYLCTRCRSAYHGRFSNVK